MLEPHAEIGGRGRQVELCHSRVEDLVAKKEVILGDGSISERRKAKKLTKLDAAIGQAEQEIAQLGPE